MTILEAASIMCSECRRDGPPHRRPSRWYHDDAYPCRADALWQANYPDYPYDRCVREKDLR